jgi:hypothetical protein
MENTTAGAANSPAIQFAVGLRTTTQSTRARTSTPNALNTTRPAPVSSISG